MRPLCIVVTGEPVKNVLASRGSFAELIRARTSFAAGFIEVDARSQPLPALSESSGIVVTGSAASVTERTGWMLRAGEYLNQAVRAGHPVLGICFGHQLLGDALGGRVERNPLGRELGTVELEVLDDDPLLSALRPFTANATHIDSVVALPPGARVLGRTEREPHAALRFGERAWGVQFHPEFDAQVMRGYVEARADLLAREGADVARLSGAATDALAGAEVLERFARVVSASAAQSG